MDSSSQSQTILDQAYRHLKEGFFEDAVQTFTDYLVLAPEDPKAYYGRALAGFQLKSWLQAENDFAKAKQLNPEDLESWVGLAMSLAMENKIYESIDVFELLLEDHPRFIRGHIQLGELYYRLGMIPKGHEQMDKALAARPSLEDRRRIEKLKGEQIKQDKRRYYRPDFEALKKNDFLTTPPAWLQKMIRFLRRK